MCLLDLTKVPFNWVCVSVEEICSTCMYGRRQIFLLKIVEDVSMT